MVGRKERMQLEPKGSTEPAMVPAGFLAAAAPKRLLVGPGKKVCIRK